MVILIALALAQAAPPFDVHADDGKLAAEHCARAWPVDFQMQAYCRHEQNVGMLQFKAVAEDIGQPIEPALEKCTADWTRDGIPDFQMIGHCAVEQGVAWRRLNRP
jgi:hypothetical protein